MGFNQKDIEVAIDFAKKRTFKAVLEGDSVNFIRTPADIPNHIRPKVVEVLESCAEYFERTIFMGEYEPRKEDLPFPEFTNSLDDINYKLNHFQEEYLFEVKKAVESEKIAHSPFAKMMLKHKQSVNKDKIDRLKKEQAESQKKK